MEEPTCITLCLICESQVSPTNEGNDTDTGALISILKKILLQQNEADVKSKQGNSEAIRLFCPTCTEVLNEWHVIQGLMSNLLVRSKIIKNRLIVNILQSNVTLPEQLQDSAALQELLEDFAAVKRAVINEYRPSLHIERLAEIPFDTLRNCFGNDGQTEEPVDLLDDSTGFEHEDCHDDWEAPTFDAAESIEIHSDDDDESDQLNRKSSSISRHVMTTRKRSPIEQCDGSTPKVKHIRETDAKSKRTRRKLRNQTAEVHLIQQAVNESGKTGRKQRSVVTQENGDFIYDGKYTVKLYGNKYICPCCALQRIRKHGMTEHILGDHIRGKGTNEIAGVGENSFLYRNQYGFTFSRNRYKCTTCGNTENKRQHMIDHLKLSHTNGEAKSVSQEQDVNEAEGVENSENPDRYCPESSDSEEKNEQDSHGEEEPVTQDIQPPSGPRKNFRWIPIADNLFMYADKYRIVFKDGRYRCPKCPQVTKRKDNMTEHIRQKHLKCVLSEKVRPKRRIVALSENEFIYGGEYGITKTSDGYICSECLTSYRNIASLAKHVRHYHILKKDSAETVKAAKEKRIARSLIELENGDIFYDGKYMIKFCGDKYLCPLCGLQRKGKNGITVHIREDHIGGKGTNEIVCTAENTFLYLNQYGFTFSNNQYKCTMCGVVLPDRSRLIDHIQFCHANVADQSMGVSKVKGQPKVPSRSQDEDEVVKEAESVENTEEDPHWQHPELSDNEAQSDTETENQTSEVNVLQETFNNNLAVEASETENSHPENTQIPPEVSETCTIETSQPADTLLPPEVSETCTIETSQPEDTPLPPEVSETCTVETSQPEGTQIAPNVQRHDISETLKAIQSIKCEAVKIEAVHMESENQSSGYNLKIETFNAAESHDETGDKKRIRRTVVVLENGDVLYDGKYNIKFLGKKYLCPVCGLQRNKKYDITEHIQADHIEAKAPTTPEVTAVAENSFLYLNQYGFSCSNNRYQCTTCGITVFQRNLLFDHIKISHVNGKDKAINVGKGKAQPKAQSSSLEDANEPESVENTEEDPDWHPTDSLDSEAQSEQDFDNAQEEEPITQDTNNPPSDLRRAFKCIPITENEFEYAGKYRVVLEGGLYKCPKCPTMIKKKLAITQHIREKHMKCVVSQKVQPFNKIVTISENEFMYGKYRITKMKNRYFCSECPTSRPTVVSLSEHIRQEHIRKNEVPEATPETEGQSTKPKTGSHILRMKKIGPNEYLFGGLVPISVSDGVYKCGSCGAEIKTLALMRYHAIQVHIRCATDEFSISVQTLEDGTFKCGKCDFVGKTLAKMNGHIENHKRNLKNTGSAEIRKKIYSVEVSPNHFDHGGWPYSFVPETGRYNCGSCNWTFPTKRNTIRHVAVWHKNPVEQAVCEECGKTFANKDYMRQHKQRHGPKTVPCPECDKLFANQDDLRGHMKTHLGEAAKTQVCEFCGKGFCKPNQLEKHRATHTGEAPYNCDDCGLGYYTQRELKNHQKTKHPKEVVRNNVPPVDANDAVVSIEIVDGVITDISSI